MWQLLFGDHAIWFGIPAVAGTFFFAFRLLLMLVTGGGNDFLHADADSAFDLHADHDHASGAFKVLSVQAISAFLMG